MHRKLVKKSFKRMRMFGLHGTLEETTMEMEILMVIMVIMAEKVVEMVEMVEKGLLLILPQPVHGSVLLMTLNRMILSPHESMKHHTITRFHLFIHISSLLFRIE
jgi:hypothetical protein